jgi:uncharacterized integral membrane protein
MARKLFNVFVLLPLAIVFVVFAVANRHLVVVSLDPFNTVDPAISLRMPLFLIIILSMIAGVLLGGIATWLRQGHWRRAARRHQAEAAAAHAQLQAGRQANPGPLRSLLQPRAAIWGDKPHMTL